MATFTNLIKTTASWSELAFNLNPWDNIGSDLLLQENGYPLLQEFTGALQEENYQILLEQTASLSSSWSNQSKN